MSLIFPRLARNFIKDGYFPTDEGTLEGILKLLEPVEPGENNGHGHDEIRALDPTCGEGTALAEIAHYMANSQSDIAVKSHGVELSPERGLHSRGILDEVIISDLTQCRVVPNQYSLMLLNPPYGDRISDKGGTGGLPGGKAGRIEHDLIRRALPALAPDGVLFLIIPDYSFSKEMIYYLLGRFIDVEVFTAATDKYKQWVFCGRKRGRATMVSQSQFQAFSEATKKKNLRSIADVAPEATRYSPPLLPPLANGMGSSIRMQIFEPRQLSEAIVEKRLGATETVGSYFDPCKRQANRRPLMRLGAWHQALALAAGYIVGVVKSDDGLRRLLIKGSTVKEKETTTEVKMDSRGNFSSEITVAKDVFSIEIWAIDITEGSSQFGEVIKIS